MNNLKNLKNTEDVIIPVNTQIQVKPGIKMYFVGISLSPSVATESGIAVIDRNLNLIRVDKVFNLNEISPYVKTIAPTSNMVVCVDLPRNLVMNNGKWRHDAKNTTTLKVNGMDHNKYPWIERFSDRGQEICDNMNNSGIDVFRYYGYYTKNMLKLVPPFKSRSPAACKYLQMIIQNNLKISGIPSNLVPLSGLDAMIGAYTAFKIATGRQNIDYKCIAEYKRTPIISPIS